jgi:hypothetical protein
MGTIRAFETSVPVHKQKLHDISNNAGKLRQNFITTLLDDSLQSRNLITFSEAEVILKSSEVSHTIIHTIKGPAETLEWSDQPDSQEKMSSSFEADKSTDFGR